MVRSEPVIIAVAGPVGSGKTTVAETLSEMMGYLYLPESQAALQYLPDRFQCPERWSFESQIAFIAFRAADIQQALRDGCSMIADRTIDENIEVFARYYYEVGCIDQRAFRTYRTVANFILNALPSPALVIYCDCSLPLSESRLRDRDAGLEPVCSSEFVTCTHTLYGRWVSSYERSPVLHLDTEIVDVRRPELVEIVADELRSHLGAAPDAAEQNHPLGYGEDRLLRRARG